MIKFQPKVYLLYYYLKPTNTHFLYKETIQTYIYSHFKHWAYYQYLHFISILQTQLNTVIEFRSTKRSTIDLYCRCFACIWKTTGRLASVLKVYISVYMLRILKHKTSDNKLVGSHLTALKDQMQLWQLVPQEYGPEKYLFMSQKSFKFSD